MWGPKQENDTGSEKERERERERRGGDRFNRYIKTFTLSVSDPQIPKTVSRLYV